MLDEYTDLNKVVVGVFDAGSSKMMSAMPGKLRSELCSEIAVLCIPD